MQPIVSIITPCFNAEKYLRETLDCLQKQTINKWECIIVNDGSTDYKFRTNLNFVYFLNYKK